MIGFCMARPSEMSQNARIQAWYLSKLAPLFFIFSSGIQHPASPTNGHRALNSLNIFTMVSTAIEDPRVREAMDYYLLDLAGTVPKNTIRAYKPKQDEWKV